MNWSDLLKMIIAAIVGMILKELFAWALKRTKPVGSRAVAWLRTHPRYIGLGIEAAVLIFMFWVLFVAGDDSKPATRADVRANSVLVVLLLLQMEQFTRHLREIADLYHPPKEPPNP